MKKNIILLFLVSLVTFCVNGCLTTTKTIEEPTLENKNAKNQGTEVISGDIEVIEAVESQDTTGRVSAAKEAAAKLLSDAKKRAMAITRDAENIYEIKKQEAEQNAQAIIANAKKSAQKEKEKILASAKKETKQAAPVPQKPKEQKLKVDNKAIKTQTEQIARKIISNAKKSASDITKAAYKNMLKSKNKGQKIIIQAEEYAKNKKKEADIYLSKKMTEADKAVAEFSKKMDKEIKSSGVPKSENEIKAQRMVDEILGAIPKNDYATFSKAFTKDLKQRFTKDKFLHTNKTLEEKLGKITKIKYLGFIKKGPLTVYMWKANFAKTSKNNEMMVRLTLGELDKKFQVFAFDIAVL